MSDSVTSNSHTDQAPGTAVQVESANRNLSALSSLLDNLEETPQRSDQASSETAFQNKLIQVRLGIASALFSALRSKHPPTAAHSLRVALGCSSWALSMEISDQARDEIEVAALLHDVGKIGVPDKILRKPGKLTHDEASAVDHHRQQDEQTDSQLQNSFVHGRCSVYAKLSKVGRSG